MKTSANKLALVEIILFLVLPLLLASSLNLETSNTVIFPFAFLLGCRIVYLFVKKRMTLDKDLFGREDFYLGSVYYVLFTAVAVVGLVYLRPYISLPEWLKNGEAVWFLALHALLQEFIFRVYALNRLKLIFQSRVVVVIVGALIFSLSHFVLPDALNVVLLTFVSGVFWSILHLRYPNFFLLVMSHFVVNLVINYF